VDDDLFKFNNDEHIKYLIKNKLINDTTNNIINLLCKYNKVNILNYIKENNYEFKYSDNAIDWACRNGHIRILD
jgi:ankyrin repeat protein